VCQRHTPRHGGAEHASLRGVRVDHVGSEVAHDPTQRVSGDQVAGRIDTRDQTAHANEPVVRERQLGLAVAERTDDREVLVT
jgi:hypothetical protein